MSDVKDWIYLLFDKKYSLIHEPVSSPVFRRYRTIRTRKAKLFSDVSKTVKE